ncbi:alpha-1,2-glucosyltransferase Alg10 [Anticarsia gemmatalis]|uniref:alpha-1,2-glucosyltransferase Alg10 n=1 Tax=Anticarsia gemmatalis TaxID=129554 RepID=UPI003F760879
MGPGVKFYGLLIITFLVYVLTSSTIFQKVYQTIQIVIDEEFHVPQGIRYCEGNFTYMDPKITTLPGLYWMSLGFIWFLDCNTYTLRLTSLFAACVNFFLFANILQYIYFNDKYSPRIVVQAFSLSILPPLYFFSFVYYSDVMSLTALMIYMRLSFDMKHPYMASAFSAMAILMRQTNVCWIGMVFLHKLLDTFVKTSRVFGNEDISDVSISKSSLIAHDIDTSKLKRYYNMWDVYYAVKYHLKTYCENFFNAVPNLIPGLSCHVSILAIFVTFVYQNGGIVLGDKTAHQITIHLPQLLYFLLFYGVFGLPYVLNKFKSTLNLIINNKLLVILVAFIMFLMVHFNTQVHPYLLADNRHFTFYVWNRWFGKYDFAIYATIPIYIFLLFSVYDNLRSHNCATFLIAFSFCTFVCLGLQKLVEIRYFLIPYIVIRLRFGPPTKLIIAGEFLWYILINAAAFNVFFTKEVFWDDYDYAQRIIW